MLATIWKSEIELFSALDKITLMVFLVMRSEKTFRKRVRRGRKFEKWERKFWHEGVNKLAEFEADTRWKGKRGRIDIRLVDAEEGHTVVIEIKATDWDAMKTHRVRPNALRHARQIWIYIEAELQGHSVLPALIYPRFPKTPGRKQEVEQILNDRLIQVVWRDEQDEIL